jgi:hypothetical protein
MRLQPAARRFHGYLGDAPIFHSKYVRVDQLAGEPDQVYVEVGDVDCTFARLDRAEAVAMALAILDRLT